MLGDIKKFYDEDVAAGAVPALVIAGDESSVSDTTAPFIIDSKFRRETSNFKVNVNISTDDVSGEDPVLLKYIEKNLKPEELIGIVLSSETNGVKKVFSIQIIVISPESEEEPEFYFLTSDTAAITADAPLQKLYYVPSTGALSLIGPYMEEEETSGRVINLDALQYDSSTRTWSGYETGLGVNDFGGAKISGNGQTKIVSTVSTVSSEDGFTIKLKTEDLYAIWYNPTTGQFKTPTGGTGVS